MEHRNNESGLFPLSGPVTVYDMASGDVLPENIIHALMDDSVTKWAFNAAFERICLSEYLRREFPEMMKSKYLCPDSWKCSMIWSAYMGLSLSLEGAGSVLGTYRYAPLFLISTSL
mgnify:CR=1 FL=1